MTRNDSSGISLPFQSTSSLSVNNAQINVCRDRQTGKRGWTSKIVLVPNRYRQCNRRKPTTIYWRVTIFRTTLKDGTYRSHRMRLWTKKAFLSVDLDIIHHAHHRASINHAVQRRGISKYSIGRIRLTTRRYRRVADVSAVLWCRGNLFRLPKCDVTVNK